MREEVVIDHNNDNEATMGFAGDILDRMRAKVGKVEIDKQHAKLVDEEAIMGF
ncbi:hypothetical protein MA16_Dca002891 [Dendrobium catenatum]|uniref:Uncharacterized protein n=1 Tax=Dendrobium catenatum TaxID=906689 RepID=A0A2I0X8X9_9ASPA|nr:hypothetical protein MA16_Dca002891 [Dendrobium catenatum]